MLRQRRGEGQTKFERALGRACGKESLEKCMEVGKPDRRFYNTAKVGSYRHAVQTTVEDPSNEVFSTLHGSPESLHIHFTLLRPYGDCAQEHNPRDCPSKADRTATIQCAACGGAHEAWNQNCPTRKEEFARTKVAYATRAQYHPISR